MDENLHDWKFDRIEEGGVRRWICTKCGQLMLADDRPDYDLTFAVRIPTPSDQGYLLRLNCAEAIAFKVHNE